MASEGTIGIAAAGAAAADHGRYRPPHRAVVASRPTPPWPSGLRQRTSNPFHAGSNPAGGATSTTSGFARHSLPRRELQGRRLVTVRFTAAISHEGEWYVARALEVEVTSQGQSIDEALTNLREALELYFEDETLPEDIEPPIIATVQLSA